MRSLNLARTRVLAVHSASDKVLHYARLRMHEANVQQTYRAGLFVPASQIDSILFDLALIFDALSVGSSSVDEATKLFGDVCEVAAIELAGSRGELTAAELMARSLALHARMASPLNFSGLTTAVETLLLKAHPQRNSLTSRQRRLRHDLALVLALEAQVVRSSALSAMGADIDLATLVDDRDQHLYLFCDRYGCLNKAEIGEELDLIGDEADTAPVPNPLIKRAMDIMATSAILLLLSPLFLVLYVAIKMEGGPAFYAQRRVGQHGRVFPCWKFRTMIVNAEELLEEVLKNDAAAAAEYAQFFKLRNDPRVTRIGRVLRRTSLDELPQLFNILIGEMSLVGPRPIAVDERDRWGSYFRIYKRLRPGLTGPWQLYFRSDHPYDEQFEHAVKYATEWSLWKDIRYLFETVAVPFRQRGAY